MSVLVVLAVRRRRAAYVGVDLADGADQTATGLSMLYRKHENHLMAIKESIRRQQAEAGLQFELARLARLHDL